MQRRKIFLVITLFVTVYILSFPVFIEAPLQVQHTPPALQIIKNLPGQSAIIYEQRPSILKFLKPVRAFLFKFKIIHWLKVSNAYFKYFVTQNLCIAIIIIALFAMFYRLSRVNSEKPASKIFNRIMNYKKYLEVTNDDYNYCLNRIICHWRSRIFYLL